MNNMDLAVCLLAQQQRREIEQREQREKNSFFTSNTYCRILSRRKKEHIFKKDEYFLTVQGLDTQETREVLVTASTYKDSHHLIQFEKYKTVPPFVVFRKKNQKQGALVVEKYSSKEDDLFLMKLYGIDSDTYEIHSSAEDFFNEVSLGDHLDFSETEGQAKNV